MPGRQRDNHDLTSKNQQPGRTCCSHPTMTGKEKWFLGVEYHQSPSIAVPQFMSFNQLFDTYKPCSVFEMTSWDHIRSCPGVSALTIYRQLPYLQGAPWRCSESLWALGTSDFEISTASVVYTQLSTICYRSQSPKKQVRDGRQTVCACVRGAPCLWARELEDWAPGFHGTSWWQFHSSTFLSVDGLPSVFVPPL